MVAYNTDISECINYGSVTSNAKSVGGIVGIFVGKNMEKCINMGTVKQTGGQELGGLIGCIGKDATPNVRNCYNTGRVIEEASNSRDVGGLIGSIYADSQAGVVNNNYNRGVIEITGANVRNIGGVVGCHTGSTVTISYNYYELGSNTVQLNAFGEGLTTENMRNSSTFVNNLNTNQSPVVWEIRNGENDGYPVFK